MKNKKEKKQNLQKNMDEKTDKQLLDEEIYLVELRQKAINNYKINDATMVEKKIAYVQREICARVNRKVYESKHCDFAAKWKF